MCIRDRGNTVAAVAPISQITLRYYATANANDVFERTLTIPANRLSQYFTRDAATGNWTMSMSSNGIGYLTNVQIELDQFSASKTISGAQALVELMGTPLDVGDITVGSSFRTDYENTSSNISVKDEATLHSMYVPIAPTVSSSYGSVFYTHLDVYKRQRGE